MEYVLRKGYADNRLKASNPSNYMCREWCSHWEMVHLVNAVCHLFSGLHTAPAFFLPHQSVLAATSLAVAMASFVHQNDERGEKGQHQLIQRVQKSIAFFFQLRIIVRVIVGTRSFVSDLASDIYKTIPKSTPGMCFMALSRQRWQPRRAESRWQIAFAPFCCRLCFLRCHAVK